MGQIRAPAVAGLFYPDDPNELKVAVARYIGDAPAELNARAPKAIIAPHAGFAYSGAIAGRSLEGTMDRARASWFVAACLLCA